MRVELEGTKTALAVEKAAVVALVAEKARVEALTQRPSGSFKRSRALSRSADA